MYTVSKKIFGALFAFTETVDAEEMKRWHTEAEHLLHTLKPPFGILVDNRNLRPGGIRPEAQPILADMQARYRKAGMTRSCVVVSSGTVCMQLERLARESGIYQWERVVNAKEHADWETIALAWIEKGNDPNLQIHSATATGPTTNLHR